MIRQSVRSAALGEKVTLLFDFQKYMAAGVTLSSAVVAASVFSGVDASPSAILSGLPSISGTVVSQVVIPTVAGPVYNVDITAQTSDSQTLTSETILAVVQEPGL